MAKEASSALPDKLDVTHPSLPLRRLERSSYDGFIRNVQPYALVVVRCLDCYHDGLASYVFSILGDTSGEESLEESMEVPTAKTPVWTLAGDQFADLPETNSP